MTLNLSLSFVENVLTIALCRLIPLDVLEILTTFITHVVTKMLWQCHGWQLTMTTVTLT